MTLEELFTKQIGVDVNLSTSLIILGAALVLGIAISLLYKFIQDKNGLNTSLTVTLLIMPITLAFIVFMIGHSVLQVFILVGLFSLVRFRSLHMHPKDLAFILLSVAVGVACGIGYVAYAALFAVIFAAVMIVTTLVGYGAAWRSVYQLRILIPETLNFDGVFDDVLNEYTTAWRLRKIRTTDFGTVFEMNYIIKLKNGVNRKEFIDKLRCKNGNLQVMLNFEPDEKKV